MKRQDPFEKWLDTQLETLLEVQGWAEWREARIDEVKKARKLYTYWKEGIKK